jgi:Cysteine-rich secretory protein family
VAIPDCVVLRGAGFACWLLLSAFSVPAQSSSVQESAPPVSSSASERALFDAANRERATRHLQPLEWNAALAAAARQHAVLMAQRNELSHQFPREQALDERAQVAGARFSSVAENVAYGPSADAVQDGWMHSPPHRANLLDPNSDAVGIAVVEQSGLFFAVEDFARAVRTLSIPEQVREIAALLAADKLTVANDPRQANQACRSEKSWNAGKQTVFVVRYTTSELSSLPDPLIREIHSGRYHTASVAACSPPRSNFTSYQIAVLLYP